MKLLDKIMSESIGRYLRGRRVGIDTTFEDVYGELRRIAGHLMSAQRSDHTLQATELVHEAYARLAQSRSPSERSHFVNLAAKAMRQILVDHARRKRAQKRGGELQRVTLDTAVQAVGPEPDLLDLHEALEELAKNDGRMASIVELRIFAGLTAQEAADTLGISKRTADTDWKVARAWLAHRLSR